MKKNILILSAVILFAILARFLFSTFGQIMQYMAMKKVNLPPVTIGTVEEAQVIKKIEAPGRILSKHRVDVVARIDGYLTKSYFKEGDFVKQGQVLFQIEPQEWLYDLQRAKANVANTKAQLIYAEKQYHRSAMLIKKEYISKAAFDEITSKRDALRSQLAMYQAELRDAQRNYSYTQVKAPVDGQVGMINVTVGNFVNQSAGVLTTIYSVNPTYVTFPIDSKEYLKLNNIDKTDLKRKVDIYFPTGEKYEFSGVQDFHDNVIDPTTGTITMRATFPNPKGKLINGEYVKANLYSTKPETVLIVPQTAVLENQQGKFIYLLDKDDIARIKFIKTAGQYKSNWIVENDIKKGDVILTSGLQKVIPDNKVKVVEDTEKQGK